MSFQASPPRINFHAVRPEPVEGFTNSTGSARTDGLKYSPQNASAIVNNITVTKRNGYSVEGFQDLNQLWTMKAVNLSAQQKSMQIN